MKARGYRLMQVWVDVEGFPGKVAQRGGARKPEMTLDQLQEVLVRVTQGADEDFTLRLYGELAAFAKGVREVWDLFRMNRDLFRQEEEKNKRSVPELFPD
ncbi:MAG: hypothetical protein LBP20_10690 [Treponema sp.]|jgi:hypothetical protein|nr:hypothetical protein [Treponema sp.]